MVDHSRTLRCHLRATRSIQSDSHLLRSNNSSSHNNSSIHLGYPHGHRTEAIRTIRIDLISSPTVFPSPKSTLTTTLLLNPRNKVTMGLASRSVPALAKHAGDSKFAASRIR